ncbi:MAG: hypothetical protein P1V81_16135 [Planctomycetota bacterium]|nr:hypothetical protein [Planctomycetota bacterium]
MTYPRSTWTRLGLFLLALLASCVNLDAVRDFANASTEAAAYEELVDEYIEHPLRMAALQGQLDMDAPPDAYIERLSQRKAMLERHEALTDYLVVLGQLAGDQAPRLERSREVRESRREARDGVRGREVERQRALDARLEHANGAPEAQDLLAKVSEALLGAWRQSAIEKYMKGADESLTQTIASLHDGPVASIPGDARTEMAGLDHYYGDLLRELQGSGQQGVRALLHHHWELERVAILDRQKAALDFQAAMDQILEGHDALVSAAKLDAQDLVSELADRARALLGLGDQLNRRPRTSSPIRVPR